MKFCLVSGVDEMSFFLFAKQIVDMLYSYKILDYAMVGFILLLLTYQILLVRPNLKEMFTVAGLLNIHPLHHLNY